MKRNIKSNMKFDLLIVLSLWLLLWGPWLEILQNPIFQSLLKQKKNLKKKLELLRKGIYPYDYMNGIKKFEETQLPPIQKKHFIQS